MFVLSFFSLQINVLLVRVRDVHKGVPLVWLFLVLFLFIFLKQITEYKANLWPLSFDSPLKYMILIYPWNTANLIGTTRNYFIYMYSLTSDRLREKRMT